MSTEPTVADQAAIDQADELTIRVSMVPRAALERLRGHARPYGHTTDAGVARWALLLALRVLEAEASADTSAQQL